MNLVALDGGRIAGSDAARPAVPQAAAHAGHSPRGDPLGDAGLAATVRSVEYLGADLVLRCASASESLLVRAPAASTVRATRPVDARSRLRWSAPSDAHALRRPVAGAAGVAHRRQ